MLIIIYLYNIITIITLIIIIIITIKHLYSQLYRLTVNRHVYAHPTLPLTHIFLVTPVLQISIDLLQVYKCR